MVSADHLKRALIAIIVTFSLLFMQLAAAAYVCTSVSGIAPGSAPVVTDMVPCSTNAPPGCNHLGATRTALCDAQAYASNEATPELRLPKLSAIAPATWLMAFRVAPEADASRQPRPHPSPGLTRAISPSLSIRNCCYRI
ncbi:hypothetical protein [Castellaniella sp.]|uniref:hypothetical protein n=1 Tax=Castellaniella sp. TaxID=1955812 RepID=UPI003C79420C